MINMQFAILAHVHTNKIRTYSVCAYMYTLLCIYAYIHICVHMLVLGICVHLRMHTCTCIQAYARACSCVHVHNCRSMYVCMHVCMYQEAEKAENIIVIKSCDEEGWRHYREQDPQRPHRICGDNICKTIRPTKYIIVSGLRARHFKTSTSIFSFEIKEKIPLVFHLQKSM